MSEKLKIVYRPLQELSPYAHNARTHSTEQVAQLVESIKQFGWTNPVLIDEKGKLLRVTVVLWRLKCSKWILFRSLFCLA